MNNTVDLTIEQLAGMAVPVIHALTGKRPVRIEVDRDALKLASPRQAFIRFYLEPNIILNVPLEGNVP